MAPWSEKPGPRREVSREQREKGMRESSLTEGMGESWQGSRRAPRMAPMSCSGSEKRAREARAAESMVGGWGVER